eukprot:TRINITY_DN33572_c0_g1_i1.p1 TRINITY_DN33572_c0_g1~~TRINITY_DN33572_c0_g1_i1.p1  ORF type:complete len:185 (+),score=27.74 TRINITY_DN33572_c0_g1_i1:34-588(+)
MRSIQILLRCKDVQKTAAFYTEKELGSWEKNAGRVCCWIKGVVLVFEQRSEGEDVTEVTFVGDDGDAIGHVGGEGKPLVLPPSSGSTPDASWSWITIIRSEDIEKTAESLAHIGLWVVEKHGSGPIHYCLSTPSTTTEIYPFRQSEPVPSIDFYLHGYLPLAPDGSKQRSVKETDPDGRLLMMF